MELKVRSNFFSKVNTKLIFLSLLSYCLSAFTSNAALNLSHIFILIPAVYYSYNTFKYSNYSKSSYFLIVYCIIAIISIYDSDIKDRWDAIGALRYYVIAVLSIPAFRYYFRRKDFNKKEIKLFISVILISTTAANLSGLIGYFTEFNPLRFAPTTDKTRSTGMYSLAITYGYGIQFFCLFSFYLILNSNLYSKYVNFLILKLGFISSLAGLYFSFSRGAILGFVSGIPFLFLNKSKKIMHLIFYLITTAIIVLMIGLFMTGGTKENRLFQSVWSESNLIRISQYKAAWEGFKESPFIGLGFSNFSNKSAKIKIKHGIEFPNFKGHAHNNFIEALVSTGILGFIPYLLFHFFWFLESYKNNTVLQPFLTGFVVTLSVSGLFQNTFTDSENIFLIMIVYSLSQVLASDTTRNSKVML
ncbi:MAG: O-antigen ligase family protein [Bdellovibrionaceae bacterium]|nr:O-antigen ligase family protein [Pseudobdellovibrionaceae bacterium]